MSTLISFSRKRRRQLVARHQFLDLLNSAARLLLAFAVDRSASTNGEPNAELNHGLGKTAELFAKNPATCRSVEMALITFGGTVTLDHPFAPPDRFRPPVLRAGGGTPLAEAGLLALQLIEERLALCHEAEIDLHTQPLAFFLTDGMPTSSDEMIAKFAREVRRVESEEIAACVALYTQGADPQQLAEIFLRPPVELASFLAGLRAISRSVEFVSQHVITPDFDIAETLQREIDADRRDPRTDW